MSNLRTGIWLRSTCIRFISLAGVASLVGCVTSPIGDGTQARIDQEAQAKIEALEHIISTASVNVRDTGKRVSQFDPLAIPGLYADTADLTKLTQTLRDQIQRLSEDKSMGKGKAQLSQSDRLRLEILSVTGAVRVQVWLDDNITAPVVPGNTYVGRSAKLATDMLGMKFDIATTTIKEWSRLQTNASAFSIFAQGKSGEIDLAYKKKVNEQFEVFLKTPYPFHEPEVRAIDFDLSTWAPGRHDLRLRIRPQRKDPLSGKWALTYRVISWEFNRPNETLREIGSGSISSDEKEYSLAPLDQWIDPPQSISVDVNFGGSTKNPLSNTKP